MQENNKTYRVHTNVREDKYLDINLNQDIEQLEILSLKLDVENFYKLHTSDYGCLVGRVLANQGVGVPNVKISLFIPVERADLENPVFKYLYPYSNVKTKDDNGVRYNLLPDVVDDKCHQDVGTFPNKRLVLDDVNVIEVFDKYFKYTTVTNAAGDYMMFGVPVGTNIIHSELDLSDIGILSQKPRDLFYKGYNKTQFENSNQFKKDTNLDYLTQIITQDNSVQIYPFWGDDETDGYDGVDRQVKITRHDIDVNYKFEPTCIFIGSLVADDKSNGFSKRCTPTERSGKMDRLTTGSGTIEMIRKTPDGQVESFSIQGNELIDGNGTWCYQIPMNLDYVKTDEFGNLVPAENEMTGIPTRTRVRFRISLADYESDTANAHLPKVLIPNNPTKEELENRGIDYNFGTYTRDESYKDLFWNNVYTVKEYIPRLQNIIFEGRHTDRNRNFSGIKAVNVNGSNNPIPYNNIRVNLTFLFIFQCIIFKALVLIVKIINDMIYAFKVFADAVTCQCYCDPICGCDTTFSYITLDGSMCPTLEGYQMALGATKQNKGVKYSSDRAGGYTSNSLIIYTSGGIIKFAAEAHGTSTIGYIDSNTKANGYVETMHRNANDDTKSTDSKHAYTQQAETYDSPTQRATSIPINPDDPLVSARADYFVKCVELQFAMEYEVIQFDFYNDWINGLIYLPRWFAELKRRKRIDYVNACNENYTGTRELVQQCAPNYDKNGQLYNGKSGNGCGDVCHRRTGRKYIKALYKNGGIIQTFQNYIDDRFLYYLRPVSRIMWRKEPADKQIGYIPIKVPLFATDIVLLGSVLECNKYGLPTAVGYPSSTFIMPPPTGQILSDSQDMSLYYTKDNEYLNRFYIQNKRTPNMSQEEYEQTQVEMSGIDWGYNPFTIEPADDDDTTKIQNQVAGHFLEIGCVAADVTPKSCLNMQRVCELGSEMAQSHYYRQEGNKGQFYSTTGIVSGREVVGEDIRTKFAAMNSNRLRTKIDKSTGYLMYDFFGYTPYEFNGGFNGWLPFTTWLNNLGEKRSSSYIGFRFAEDITSAKKIAEDPLTPETNTDVCGIISRCLYEQQGAYTMPVYENSFYFYFGLKDGNTAIDRLYSEYFSECVDNSITETGSIKQGNTKYEANSIENPSDSNYQRK